jgi:hypothetical protein
MPVLLLGVGALIVVFLVLHKKALTPSGGVPGTKESGGLITAGGGLTTKRTTAAENTVESSVINALAPTTTQRGANAGKVTGLAGAVDTAGAVIGAGFHDEAAGEVFTYGIAAAVALATVNAFAAAAVAYVAVFAAIVIDEIDYFTDMGRRDMQKGIDKFWSDWNTVYAHVVSIIQNKAMVAGQKADPNQIDLAATAFADGYMLRVNYLRAWYAYCGGMFQTSFLDQQGADCWRDIARAYFIGAYAGTAPPTYSTGVGGWYPYRIPVQPVLNMYASYPFQNLYGPERQIILTTDYDPATVNPFSTPIPLSIMKGKFGDTALDVHPPAVKSDTRSDAVSVAWRQMGTLAGDASQFLQACMAPHGVGQSDLSSNVWYRDRGMFQGACNGAGPNVPKGTGYTLGNVSAYSPDNKSIIFTKVG